jgi:hypothetical protein
MKKLNHSVRLALTCRLLVFGLAWPSPADATKPGGGSPGPAGGTQAGVTYSGRAFAAFVNVPTLYRMPDTCLARLTVTDDEGATGTAAVSITVGGSCPQSAPNRAVHNQRTVSSR